MEKVTRDVRVVVGPAHGNHQSAGILRHKMEGLSDGKISPRLHEGAIPTTFCRLEIETKKLAHSNPCRAGRFAADVFNLAITYVATRKATVFRNEDVKRIEDLRILSVGVVDKEKIRVVYD